MRRCSNSYCMKEYRSEECHHLRNRCACGGELKLKIENEKETIKIVQDRDNAKYCLTFLKNYILNDVKTLEFPLQHTLTGYKTFIENQQKEGEANNDILSEEDSDIDERYNNINDYPLKYIKVEKDFRKKDKRRNLILNSGEPLFGETLKKVNIA